MLSLSLLDVVPMHDVAIAQRTVVSALDYLQNQSHLVQAWCPHVHHKILRMRVIKLDKSFMNITGREFSLNQGVILSRYSSSSLGCTILSLTRQ